MKVIRFKDDNTKLQVSGLGVISNSNITQQKYDYLIRLNEKHAELFEIVEEPETKKTKS